MEIPKDKILDLLRQRDDDTDRDAGVLSKLGVDPKDLAGGLGDKIGL